MPNPLRTSFDFAIHGLVYVLRTQRNMRVHAGIAILVLVAAAFLHVGRLGLTALVFAISLVLILEAVNTAIEATVDLVVDHYDPLAKIAKDVSAGAVLIAAVNALVVGYLVMFEPLRVAAAKGFAIVRAAPADLTVIALGLVSIVVIILKAASHSASFMHGGWPSGHTALAFGAATILGYVTENSAALVLAMGLALLVAQSRIEGRIHSTAQVIAGALVGVTIVIAVFQTFFH